MPIQVISHQPDPLAQQIQQSGNSIADTIQKQQQLAIERMKIDYQVKNAQTDLEKHKLEQKRQFLDMMVKVKEQGIDPNLVLPLFKDTFGEDETMKNFAEFGKALRSSPGSAQDQKAQAEANAINDPGAYLSKIRQGIQQQIPQAQADMSQGQGQSPNLVMSSYKTPLGDLTDISAMGQIEAAKQAAQEGVKKQMKQDDYATALSDFLDIESQLQRNKDAQGPGNIGQVINFQKHRLAQDEGGIYKTYYDKVTDLQKYIARRVDVGNLSQYEQKAARNLIPLQEDTKAVRDRKVAYLLELANPDVKGNRARVKDILNRAGTEFDNSPRAKAVRDMSRKTGQVSPQDDEYTKYLQAIGAL